VDSEGSSPDFPEWFLGTKLNYAENLLTRRDDGIAITAVTESGKVTDYSYRALCSMVQRMAAAMKAKEMHAGDRVAGEHKSHHKTHDSHLLISQYLSHCDKLHLCNRCCAGDCKPRRNFFFDFSRHGEPSEHPAMNVRM
jgi:hypothetical protein